MNVEAIHALADLERARAIGTNAIIAAERDLNTILTALQRPDPKVAICISRLEQLSYDLGIARIHLDKFR